MNDMKLERIDWTENSIDVSENSTVLLNEHTALSRGEVLQNIISIFDEESNTDYYVYCLEIDENNWYVGETSNLPKRFSAHKRDKNITNIERIEEVQSRKEARERERELSYEMAIEKETTDIYGGR